MFVYFVCVPIYVYVCMSTFSCIYSVFIRVYILYAYLCMCRYVRVCSTCLCIVCMNQFYGPTVNFHPQLVQSVVYMCVPLKGERLLENLKFEYLDISFSG